MKIPQSFGGVGELKNAQRVTRECAILTYELQVITRIITNIIHDAPVDHPFGDHGETPVLEGVRNAGKTENVGMGQVLPHSNFFTEVLYGA